MADAGPAEPAWSFVSADDDSIFIKFFLTTPVSWVVVKLATSSIDRQRQPEKKKRKKRG